MKQMLHLLKQQYKTAALISLFLMLIAGITISYAENSLMPAGSLAHAGENHFLITHDKPAVEPHSSLAALTVNAAHKAAHAAETNIETAQMQTENKPSNQVGKTDGDALQGKTSDWRNKNRENGLPFTEDFGSTSIGSLPVGWTVDNVGHSITNWAVHNSSTAGGDAPQMRLTGSTGWGGNCFFGLSRLVSPSIDVAENDKLRLKLKQYLKNSLPFGNTIAIQVSFGENGVWENLWDEEITGNIAPHELELYFTVPEGKSKIRLGFEYNGWSMDINNWNIDDINLDHAAEYDLAAVSITGNATPSENAPTVYAIEVQNTGTATQTTYTVKLMGEDGEPLNSVTVTEPIGFLETRIHTLTHTFTTTGATSIYGRVELDGDEVPGNNQTPELDIYVVDEHILFYEVFNYTIGDLPTDIGWEVEGAGETCWEVHNTSTAGGDAPQMRLTGSTGWGGDCFFGLSRLVSPSIDVTENDKLRLKLKQYLNNSYLDGNTIAIQVSFYEDEGDNWTDWEDNVRWSQEITGDIPPHELELYFAVPEGKSKIRLGFEYNGGWSDAINNWDIDNIILEHVTEAINLAAVSITGNHLPIAGEENIYTYTIEVKNLGTATQTNYTVKLMGEDGEPLNSVTVNEPIGFSETRIHTLTHTFTTTGATSIYGLVELDGDEVPGNNQTPDFDIYVVDKDKLLYEVFDYDENGDTPILPPGWKVDEDEEGENHWRVHDSSTAGGVAPQLRLSNEMPDETYDYFSGLSRLVSPSINPNGKNKLRLKLKQYLERSVWAKGYPTIAIRVSFDDGATWDAENSLLWSQVITGDIPAHELDLYFAVPANKSNIQIGFEFDGYSGYINYWDIDDIVLEPVTTNNDLAAVSIAGDNFPSAGVPSTYTITIQNAGIDTQSNYTVKLNYFSKIPLVFCKYN